MPDYRLNFQKAAHRRVRERDRRIRTIGREIDRWTRSLQQRLLGIVAADFGGRDGVLGSVETVLIGAIQDASDLLETDLRKLWQWSWKSATRNWIDALPLRYWLRRLEPVRLPVPAREGALWEYASELDADTEWDRIINGEVSEAEAKEIVRKLEFGEPTPAQVDAVLDATNAADGLSAMERIKTVLPKDLENLRGVIRSGLTTDFRGASAVQSISKAIRPLLDTNEGINWKAKRIARTEGVRIAEAGQRASWEAVADLLKGIRTWTAGDANVRDEHQKWHDKLYYRTGVGTYVARDGEPLPEFPAGPNCRCYTTQELRDELYKDVPPVNWGTYTKARARFQRQEKTARKVKEKPTVKPKPSPKLEPKTLSQQEKDAVLRYQSVDHADDARGYRTVNDYLRFADPGLHDPKTIQGAVDELDSSIAKSVLEKPQETWRGVADADKVFGAPMDQIRKGVRFEDHAFVSTAARKDVADGFAGEAIAKGKRNVAMFRIQSKPGQQLLNVDKVKNFGETERLIPRGTKFEVIQVKQVEIETGDVVPEILLRRLS
jgi:hypothetical protein